MLAIVKLVVVTVNLAAVTGAPLLVKVMFGGGLALSIKRIVNCSPSVGVAVIMVGVNRGGAGERNGEDVQIPYLLHSVLKGSTS